MKIRNALALLCLSLVAVGGAWAEETHAWEQTTAEDFSHGEARGLSIRSDGALELAPRLEQIDETPGSYFWDMLAAPDGSVYAAAGPEASVIRISPNGERSVLFRTDAIEIHALALDGDGNLYAAAAPEAKIYKITPSGQSTLFYDPQAPYVWDMAFGPDGALYIATGDRGQVHRVEPDGQGAVFFETGDVHVRSLAFDSAGRLVIGTDPSGLVLRIDASGGEARGFVLYQTPRKEVTAIAVAPDGSIYAAGVGMRNPQPGPIVQPQPAPVQPGAPQQEGRAGQPDTSTSANQAAAQAARQSPAALALQVRGGSSIVRISPEGEPVTYWESNDAIVYALGFDALGRLLIGTGDEGRLYRADSPDDSRLATTLDSNQITAIAAGPRGAVLLGASNIGKLYRLGPGLEQEGTFESDLLDAGIFSAWGDWEWDGDASGGAVDLSLRSGNLSSPQRNWSEWSGEAAAPSARYAQLRVTLQAGRDGASPVVEALRLYYRPVNRQPRIVGLEVTPPNYRFPSTRPVARPDAISLPPLGTPPRRQVQQAVLNQTLIAEPGWLAVRWQAEDPNEDALRASIEIRGENEANWVLLAKDVEESEYSWDSTALPDGRYRLRITVSDAIANPPDQALSSSRETELFLIDNTAPAISGLTAAAEDGGIRVRFAAEDAASRLTGAEFSVNGGDWTRIDPTNNVFDARSLAFDFVAQSPSGDGGVAVAVRVYDELKNVAAARAIIR